MLIFSHTKTLQPLILNIYIVLLLIFTVTYFFSTSCCLLILLVEKWTTSHPTFHHVSEILIQNAIYNNAECTSAVCIICLPACTNAFSLFLKNKLNHGRFKTRLFNFFPRFLTNGNILILAFIPQDWKHNFMITSLLEPCLIIPNYAARHLVHSVSPTMQPEQQLARCSVCVQSPWYHRCACSPILAGYNAWTYAVILIIQHGIVQVGVYSVSKAPAPFFSNLLRSLPKHGACSVSGPACGAWGRLPLTVGEENALLTQEGCERVCIYKF